MEIVHSGAGRLSFTPSRLLPNLRRASHLSKPSDTVHAPRTCFPCWPKGVTPVVIAARTHPSHRRLQENRAFGHSSSEKLSQGWNMLQQQLFIEENLEVKFPTGWTDKKAEGRVREEKKRRKKIRERKGQKKKDAGMRIGQQGLKSCLFSNGLWPQRVKK